MKCKLTVSGVLMYCPQSSNSICTLEVLKETLMRFRGIMCEQELDKSRRRVHSAMYQSVCGDI